MEGNYLEKGLFYAGVGNRSDLPSFLYCFRVIVEHSRGTSSGYGRRFTGGGGGGGGDRYGGGGDRGGRDRNRGGYVLTLYGCSYLIWGFDIIYVACYQVEIVGCRFNSS